jgi:hypothetical protein
MDELTKTGIQRALELPMPQSLTTWPLTRRVPIGTRCSSPALLPGASAGALGRRVREWPEPS